MLFLLLAGLVFLCAPPPLSIPLPGVATSPAPECEVGATAPPMILTTPPTPGLYPSSARPGSQARVTPLPPLRSAIAGAVGGNWLAELVASPEQQRLVGFPTADAFARTIQQSITELSTQVPSSRPKSPPTGGWRNVRG